MNYKKLFTLVFIVCFAILTYLLLMEMPPAKDNSIYKDKLQHIAAFGGLTVWGILAFRKYYVAILLGLTLFGALMEVLQGALTTTRQPSIYDWYADIVGIVLAWLVVMLLQRWWEKRHG